MTIFRRGRVIFWIGKELFDKYTKSLVSGAVIGVSTMVALWFFSPTITAVWLSPVERIGVIGDFSPSSIPNFIQQQLSLGLTSIGSDGSAIPALADSWESTDSGKTYIFTLRDSYKWPDEKTVVSQDVNYSIRDVTFLPIDDKTLKVSLKDPYSPLPTLVSKPIFKRGLVGFGAYKVSDLTLKGDLIQSMRLTAKNDSTMPNLEYRFYRTEAQAITAYKLGDIDKIYEISSANEFTSWKNSIVSQIIKYDQIVAVFFNLKDPLLQERAFRQALGYAMPQTELERAISPISKNSWAFSDKIRVYDYDIEQAKKILSQAEIEVDQKEITITTFPQYVDVAERIAESWETLGLTVKVKIENTLPEDFQALLSVQNLPPDPDQYPFWHSTQQNTNVTKYANVRTDKILEDARKENDIATRKKLYADFQRFLAEDAPAVFYFYPIRYTVIRK